MQCFGNYNVYDRICQLCSETNLFTACRCKRETKLKNIVNDEIFKCPYREIYYDKDRDEHWNCTKSGYKCHCYYLKWGE